MFVGTDYLCSGSPPLWSFACPLVSLQWGGGMIIDRQRAQRLELVGTTV